MKTDALTTTDIERIVATKKRRDRLEWNERQMSTAAKTIASSLKDIHDNELWKDDYASFEEYAKTKWGISRQRAYQMIGAENVRLMLADSEDTEIAKAAPTLNNRQASELATVPSAQRAEVLKAAQQENPKAPTSAIKRAKAKIIDSETGQPEPEIEQQEFRFTFKTTAEHREDFEWFETLTDEQRGQIITEARSKTE